GGRRLEQLPDGLQREAADSHGYLAGRSIQPCKTGCSGAGSSMVRLSAVDAWRDVRCQTPRCWPESQRQKPTSNARFMLTNSVVMRRKRTGRLRPGSQFATMDRA